MSKWHQDQSDSAGKCAQRFRSSEPVALCNATGQDDQSGRVRDAARAVSCRTRRAEGFKEHGPETTPGTQTESSGHLQTHQRCIRESHGTSSNEAVGSSLERRRVSKLVRWQDKRKTSSAKRDQSKMRGATRSTASGKTAGHCEDCAHASSHTDDQENSGSGSSGHWSIPGEGNAPDCKSGKSKMCIGGSERTSIHTNPERKGRRCENSTVVDRMMGVILRRRTHQSAITTGTTSSCGAAGDTQNSGTSTTTKRTTGRGHGEHTFETNTTRGVNQAKEHTPTCDEERMKAMRSASALDPSIYLGDTQA